VVAAEGPILDLSNCVQCAASTIDVAISGRHTSGDGAELGSSHACEVLEFVDFQHLCIRYTEATADGLQPPEMENQQRCRVVRPLHAMHRHDGGRRAVPATLAADAMAIAMREDQRWTTPRASVPIS
jgi:hypothetical protein